MRLEGGHVAGDVAELCGDFVDEDISVSISVCLACLWRTFSMCIQTTHTPVGKRSIYGLLSFVMLTIFYARARKSVDWSSGPRMSSRPNESPGIDLVNYYPDSIGNVFKSYPGCGGPEFAFSDSIFGSADLSDCFLASDASVLAIVSPQRDLQGVPSTSLEWPLHGASFDTLYAHSAAIFSAPRALSSVFERQICALFGSFLHSGCGPQRGSFDVLHAGCGPKWGSINGTGSTSCWADRVGVGPMHASWDFDGGFEVPNPPSTTVHRPRDRLFVAGREYLWEYAAGWWDRRRRHNGARGPAESSIGGLMLTCMLFLSLVGSAIFSLCFSLSVHQCIPSLLSGFAAIEAQMVQFVLLFLAFRAYGPGPGSCLLFLAWFLQPADAVCSVCGGFFEGCTGGDDGKTCSGAKAVTDNAAALVASSATAVSLVGLFSVRVLRVFNTSVLAVLKHYASAPVAGTPFNFTSASNAQVVGAVIAGRLSKSEALVYFANKIETVAALEDETSRTSQMASIETQIKLLGACDERPSASSSTAPLAGVLHFVWGKCSEVVLGGDGKVSIGDEKGAKGLAVTSKIHVPNTAEDFFETLSLWQAVVVQIGMAPLMVVFSLVDRAVWQPMRAVNMPWPVAHELLLTYLSLVDQSVDRSVTLCNVCDKAGVDVPRSEAVASALKRFGSKFQSDIFRFSGGTRGQGGDVGSTSVPKYNGKCSENSSRPCEAYNRGVEHLAKHLHPDGTCKFKHGCGKWIKLPDGTIGYCMRSHPWGKCDRDPAECSKVGPPRK